MQPVLEEIRSYVCYGSVDRPLRFFVEKILSVLPLEKHYVMAVFTKDYVFRNFPVHSESFRKFRRLLALLYDFDIWFWFSNVILGNFVRNMVFPPPKSDVKW